MAKLVFSHSRTIAYQQILSCVSRYVGPNKLVFACDNAGDDDEAAGDKSSAYW